jgi:hypothetical protein
LVIGDGHGWLPGELVGEEFAWQQGWEYQLA